MRCWKVIQRFQILKIVILSKNQESKASFIGKISIVIEEIDESNFWLEFALDEKFEFAIIAIIFAALIDGLDC